jgi:hypothetical protein
MLHQVAQFCLRHFEATPYDPVLVPALSRCCTIFSGALGKELLLKGEWDGLVWGQAVWGLGIGVV